MTEKKAILVYTDDKNLDKKKFNATGFASFQ